MACVALAAATPAPGQEAHGLSAIAGGGYERGGPGSSLAGSLAAIGFDDRLFEGGGGWVDHPRLYDAGLNLVFFLGGHYRFPGPYSIDAILSNGSRGHAQGYDGSGPDRLLLRWSSLLLTSSVGVHLGPVRLAAGPTVNVLVWDTERNWSDERTFVTPVPGATAVASARFSAGDVLASLQTGVRTFAPADLAPALSVPLKATYSTWFVGVTILPVR
ncbi:MAG: hypothetical protein R6U63_12930 [Longimicrobiales bacterium]